MLSRLQNHRFVFLCLFIGVIGLLIGASHNVRLPKYKVVVAATALNIRIPSVSIAALVEDVGLTTDGALDVPKDPLVVGLFTGGVYPGEIGTAVMDGHFGSSKKRPAAFDSLSSVEIGNKVYVNNGRSEIVFTVRAMRLYGKDEIIPKVFYSNDNKAHLNLITCSGAWSATEKSYSDRWVVFSERE